MDIKKYIRSIENHPVEGVTFRDLTTLFRDGDGFKKAIDQLVEVAEKYDPDLIVGIEARGFIVGAPVAYALECGFVPVRKPGKLPLDVESIEYELEYGQDSIEIHKDGISKGDKVVVIDDLLATGGTSEACKQLINTLGGEIKAFLFLTELSDLKGRDRLEGYDVISITDYD